MHLHKSQQLTPSEINTLNADTEESKSLEPGESTSPPAKVHPVPDFAKMLLLTHPWLIGRFFPVYENDARVVHAHNQQLREAEVAKGIAGVDF